MLPGVDPAVFSDLGDPHVQQVKEIRRVAGVGQRPGIIQIDGIVDTVAAKLQGKPVAVPRLQVDGAGIGGHHHRAPGIRIVEFCQDTRADQVGDMVPSVGIRRDDDEGRVDAVDQLPLRPVLAAVMRSTRQRIRVKNNKFLAYQEVPGI